MVALILAVTTTVMIAGVFFMIKTENAYDNQVKILDAIVEYGHESGDLTKAMHMLDHIESLFLTIFRMWDWGYTRILPKEDFELIKPYLEEK